MNNASDTAGWLTLAGGVLVVGLFVDLSPEATPANVSAVTIVPTQPEPIAAEQPNDRARTPLSAPSPISGSSRDAADGAGWMTWEEALEEQGETGRPVLVFQHFADPNLAAACKPCKVLANLLDEPGVLDRVAELGIPATDTVERWQPEPHLRTAPAIAYVPAGSPEGAKAKQLTGRSPTNPKGFDLSDADAFLASLKAWLDGI